MRPDVLLINEFDFDAGRRRGDLFRDNYLDGRPARRSSRSTTRTFFVAPSNTGMPSGFDLNNNGDRRGGGDDAFGFGAFEGQFGMVVYSKYPIDVDGVRTFQHFLWKDMPGALLPDDPATPSRPTGTRPRSSGVRLSSQVPLGRARPDRPATVHFLVSHPTPPVFDGAEDRNGRRNLDEIRFWAD